MPLNQYHRALMAAPEYRELVKLLRSKTPVVAQYDYQTDNVRQIVFDTARKQGFELALAYLES